MRDGVIRNPAGGPLVRTKENRFCSSLIQFPREKDENLFLLLEDLKLLIEVGEMYFAHLDTKLFASYYKIVLKNIFTPIIVAYK